jgi:outer membrane biosynthesis protein TonB
MSELQKMLASVSGAFVAHLLILLVVVVLPRAHSSASAAASRRAENGPREVTIDMGELMKRLEREREEEVAKKPEPETPEPEPEPPAPVRPFVATDTNQAEAVAPENARFESDRNTSAASRLRPDESLPQFATPTLAGKSPLPHLTLANRDHVDGPLESMPASPDPLKRRDEGDRPGAPAPSTPAGGNAPDPSAATPPTPAMSAAPATPAMPAFPAAVPPAVPTVGQAPIPAVPPPPSGAEGARSESPVSVKPGRAGLEEVGATREKSFVDASARIEAPALPEGEDRVAAGVGSGQEGKSAMETREPDPLESASKESTMPRENPEDATGETDPDAIPEPPAATPATPAMPADPVTPAPAAMAAAPAPPAAPGGGVRPADEGLFAKGFSPEERQNVINGSLAKEGDAAVDAIDTPVGRYKKAVRDRISATWHRYRRDNAEFVTWGILKIEFTVDSSGRVRDLEITKNEANAMLAEFSLRAIRDAKLPPMPEDVAKTLGSQGLVIQYDIIIY